MYSTLVIAICRTASQWDLLLEPWILYISIWGTILSRTSQELTLFIGPASRVFWHTPGFKSQEAFQANMAVAEKAPCAAYLYIDYIYTHTVHIQIQYLIWCDLDASDIGIPLSLQYEGIKPIHVEVANCIGSSTSASLECQSVGHTPSRMVWTLTPQDEDGLNDPTVLGTPRPTLEPPFRAFRGVAAERRGAPRARGLARGRRSGMRRWRFSRI